VIVPGPVPDGAARRADIGVASVVAVMLVIGIVIFALGLAFSIAWHELGHYSTARMFGIRVPEFMVGFGPTVLSKRIGETEVGIKAVPLGGYIRMIGMIPPAPGETLGRSRRSGPVQSLIDDVRASAVVDPQPGDEHRQFYTRAPWKRIVVMFAGPLMNLVLAIALFAVVLMGFGVAQATTTIGTVSRCAVPVPSARAAPEACPPGAPLSPAFAAGLRPDDRIVSFGGVAYPEWSGLLRAIRAASGPTPIVVDRGGVEVPLTVDVLRTQVSRLDGPGTEFAGFVGLSTSRVNVAATPGEFVGALGGIVDRTFGAIAAMPSRVPNLVDSVFAGEQRAEDSPVSVVGASVISGRILEQDRPVADEIALMIQLLAAVNLSLFVLNLLPILPLDGGHILPALWEAAKKRIWRLRGRPDPGPVDLARLMPVAYGMVVVILAFGGLVVIADIINPVKLPL